MGLIQNLIKGMGENKKELKQKFKDAQQDLKIQTMLEERQKSANQRELERYVKEQDEKEKSYSNRSGKSVWSFQNSCLSGS